jgi:transposase
MREKSNTTTSPSERLVKNIRGATRKHYSAEEKIRIVLDGLRGESSIAELCRREGIAEGLYYSCRRSSSKPENVGWRATRHVRPPAARWRTFAVKRGALKEVVAEQALELRLLKKSMTADGGDEQWDTLVPRSWRSSAWSSNPTCRSDGRWPRSASCRWRFTGGMPVFQRLGPARLQAVQGMQAIEDGQVAIADRSLPNPCSRPKIRCSAATNSLFQKRWTHR